MILFLRLKLHTARLAWPATILLLLLQRTPVLRMLTNADMYSGGRVGQILRAMIPTAFVIGATNTLTGQTRWDTNPAKQTATSLTVTGPQGTPLAVAFGFTGGSVSPESYAIVGTLPPGMSVPNATGPTGNLTVNGFAGSVTGTPTAAGMYSLTLTAYDGPNRGAGEHGSSPVFDLQFIIQASTAPPEFTTHPTSQTVLVGTNVTFTVAATGSPAPALQWRKDTQPLTGQTGTSLTLTSVILDSAGSYDCVAINAEGSATSNPATLTVREIPAFTTHPVTQTVNAGGSVTFTVAATGTPAPTLQWRKDTEPLTGETGPSLTINPVNGTHAGIYDCVATNVAGSATSNPATLTVHVAPAFSTHPSHAMVDYRGSATFTVVVTGNPTPTLQWRKDTVDLPGETGTSLVRTNLGLDANGDYDCVATNSVSSVTSNSAQLMVHAPDQPAITTQPIAITARQNTFAFFSTMASGVELSYQWRKDGDDIPGESNSSLLLANVTDANEGDYSVRVTNPGGFVDSVAVPLNVVATGGVRLVNLSARALVGAGGNILIPGFVVGGSGSKTVLMRTVGPRLADFGVPGVLGDPTMQLFRGPVGSEQNDDWTLFADQTLLETTRAAVFAFPLTSVTQPPKDAAMVVSLEAGATNYTIQAAGVGGTTGVALVELFDADPISASARFVNISARAQVGTGGDVLIPGFFIEGNVALTVLIRAVGPRLADFGVPNTLDDPVMTLFRISNSPNPGDQEIMTTNDDWEQTPNPAALETARITTSAFPFNSGSADAALLVSLNPGGYTVKVEGKNGTTGVALMEIYLVGP